mmetsp:Transcript_120803/g.352868  ORF Transcript_120803/g.352868 Transcript_120803/m.352868 type:complete len:205 (+) Transcript_120803:8-622(+)
MAAVVAELSCAGGPPSPRSRGASSQTASRQDLGDLLGGLLLGLPGEESPVQPLERGAHPARDLQKRQQIDVLRLSPEGVDAVDELMALDLAITIIEELEEVFQVPDVQVHSGEELPHDVVDEQQLELVPRDVPIPRLVQLLKDLLELLGIGPLGPLLTHDHDLVVSRGHSVRLCDEDGSGDIDQGEAENAAVEDNEEAPPLTDV